MIKVTISKQNVITNQGTFKTKEEANSWVAFHESQESFGKPQHETQVLVSEAIPEVLDENGNVIQETVEAVYETKVIPAEYTIEVENITQQVSLEKSKQEQKKLAKEKRKADRKAIDFDKINTVKELKAYLKLYLDDLEG